MQYPCDSVLSVDHSTGLPAPGPNSWISGPPSAESLGTKQALATGRRKWFTKAPITTWGGGTIRSGLRFEDWGGGCPFCFLVRISHVIQIENLGFQARIWDVEELGCHPAPVGSGGEPRGV